jgi:hypothetical protein
MGEGGEWQSRQQTDSSLGSAIRLAKVGRPVKSHHPSNRRSHDRCACSRSARSRFGVAIGQDLQFVEHGGDTTGHADLIGCGMVGLSLLHGALDVNGERVRGRQNASDKRLTARTVPDDRPSSSSTLRVPSAPPANLG